MKASDYGRLIECTMEPSAGNSHIKHSYTLFIPDGFEYDKECAVLLHLDADNIFLAKPMMELRDAGRAPNFIMIGLPAGLLVPKSPDGFDLWMRGIEFDDASPDFPNYVVDEIFTAVERENNIKISREPIHFVGGCSSGGGGAWNFLWFRNDLFRRGFISSPSFFHARNMSRHVNWIRKYETKPIRVFMTVAEDEPDNHFGNSYIGGIGAESSLKYAGYDYQYEYMKGEVHCARCCEIPLCNRIMEYMYGDWPNPIKPLKYTDRFEKNVDTTQTWEKCDEMPGHIKAVSVNREYSTDGKNIYCSVDGGEKFTVAEGFHDIRELAVSVDLCKLYIADNEATCIYGMSILPDGTLTNKYVHVPLELYTGYHPKGACGICVDTRGRAYAATQLGVQMILSAGFVDIIMPAPRDLPVEELAFGGEDNSYLYIRTADGIFRRKMLTTGRSVDTPAGKSKTMGYYSM